MRPSTRATSGNTLRQMIAAGLFSWMTINGCNQADPLEAVRAQHAAGDYAGSIEPLRELLATDPENAETNYRYGLALTATNRSGLSVWSFRKAMKDPDWFVPAGESLAFAALSGHDFNEVVEVTSQLLEAEPDNLSALLMRANAYAHWKKDPELALADADRVLELNPDLLEAYEPRILALLSLERLGDAAEALAEAGRRLRESEDSEAMNGVLGWHCSTTALFELEAGDLEPARETWAECLEAHPTHPLVVSNALDFYDAQGEPERAIEVLKAAVAAAPTARDFRGSLAIRLSQSGERAVAEALLREPTKSKSPSVAAAGWMDLAEFQRGQGEFGAAADAMERGFEVLRDMGARESPYLFGYADTLVLAGRLEGALDVAEHLSVAAERHLIRGRVAQERREPARALREFDEANRLWPDNPWARYYSALAAEEVGDFQQALEQYRYSVRIRPGATNARTRGAKLLLALRQPANAMQMLIVGQADEPLEIAGKQLQLQLALILGQPKRVAELFGRLETGRAVQALVAAAESAARHAGVAKALDILVFIPVLDLSDPSYSAALRARVRFSHRAEGATQHAVQPAELATLLAAHPDSSAFQEIRGLDLELSGAPADAAHAAYTLALELEPSNAEALAGLGRLASATDAQAGLVWFERAVSTSPSDPDLQLQAARALVAAGKSDRAAERLDQLLLDHPFEAEAAMERARLDLRRGIATEQTLERARRAVILDGGPDALELLSRVHTQRNEPEPASRAAERAQELRETAASQG